MDCGKRTFHRRRVIIRCRSSAAVDDGPNGSTSRLLRNFVDCTLHSNRTPRDDHRRTKRRTRTLNYRERISSPCILSKNTGGYKKAWRRYWNCLLVDERPFPPLYRVRTLGLNKSKTSEGRPIIGHKGRTTRIQVGNPNTNLIRPILPY